jgi:antitoxin component HigA of HigAB toxin-antitoxin module
LQEFNAAFRVELPHPPQADRRVFGHYGRSQCSRSGRSSIENTVNLVCEILNRIRPLTLNMIRRLHQTPGFPDEKNFIHRRQSLPA